MSRKFDWDFFKGLLMFDAGCSFQNYWDQRSVEHALGLLLTMVSLAVLTVWLFKVTPNAIDHFALRHADTLRARSGSPNEGTV